MNLTIKEVIKATGGELICGKLLTKKINNISIDSRNIKKDDLFIAIIGERYDAHQFIDEVINKGAIGCIVSKDIKKYHNKVIIKVKDTKCALQDIARYYYKKFNTKIIGITGSSGKTTTKEILYNILSSKYKVLKTKENYNNEIGIPLTIFSLQDNHQFAIFEMATRNIGDIKLLTEIAPPSIGIITTIGKAHIGRLNSLNNIFKAKFELIEGLKKDGVAILNKDNNYLKNLSEQKINKKLLFFSINNNSQFMAKDIQIIKDKGFNFTISFNNKEIQCFLPLLGMNNIYNALAAGACAFTLGIDITSIKNGIANIEEKLKGRLNLIITKKFKIIDDAYNANPDSVKQALWVLKNQIEGKRRIAILGDMLELGKRASYEHRRIGVLINKYKLDYLITVGKLAKYIAESVNNTDTIVCRNNEEAIIKLNKIIRKDDIILVKGSRAMKMEEIVYKFADSR